MVTAYHGQKTKDWVLSIGYLGMYTEEDILCTHAYGFLSIIDTHIVAIDDIYIFKQDTKLTAKL